MNYTIYRGSWRCGGDKQELSQDLGNTSLYEARTKMMCCLGQCAFEGGVPLEKLVYVGEPGDVSDEEPKLILCGLLNDGDDYGRQSQFSNQAISINDDASISDQRREEMLIELAAQHSHTIAFVDGPAPWFSTVKP